MDVSGRLGRGMEEGTKGLAWTAMGQWMDGKIEEWGWRAIKKHAKSE